MVSLDGFLLDADYVTQDGKAVVRLWCRDFSGKRVLIFDPNFEPYFYAVPRYALDKISVERTTTKSRDELVSPKRVEEVGRRIFGKKISAYKIYLHHPSHVPPLREAIRNTMDVYEADILYAIRYLIDKNLSPVDGIKAEGEKIETEYCDTAILASRVEPYHIEKYPELKVLAFDCEMAVEHGLPSAEKDPIILLSLATSDGRTEIFSGDSERQIIEDFLHFIKKYDPDAIVGYNSDAFDWPYLRARAQLNKIPLLVGVDNSKVEFKSGGFPSPRAAGRWLVDIYRAVKRDLPEVKVKKLENVAEYLGVMKRGERIELSPDGIYQKWKSGEVEELHKYARADVQSTLGIAKKLLPLTYEFSRMTRYPPDESARMGRGRLVEAFLSAEAYKVNELIPPKGGGGETYEGGYVLPPKKGVHENVVCLDFSSMYPSIMVSFNISPDRLSSYGDVWVAPEVNHKFLKTPDGFFKNILKNLIKRREEIKKQMRSLSPESREYQELDIKQHSLKILTNSFYGYTGWRTARWYRKECAEATAAWGRYFIKSAIHEAENLGLEVIYGDTDSLFIKIGENKIGKVEKLRSILSKKLPLELDVENFYKVIFFTEKKKRYAGMTKSDDLIVRGLEVRRGDWCELAKDIQSEIIRVILEERDERKAISLVKETIKKIREDVLPVEKFVIYKTLTKRVSDYEAKQAHVIAAARAEEHELDYDVGSKIPFVIVKGSQLVSERAYPLEIFLSSGLQLDKDYYIRHQILPVALRILKYFGYTEEELLSGIRQESLSQWLR
jgi:DNA polymerase I